MSVFCKYTWSVQNVVIVLNVPTCYTIINQWIIIIDGYTSMCGWWTTLCSWVVPSIKMHDILFVDLNVRISVFVC